MGLDARPDAPTPARPVGVVGAGTLGVTVAHLALDSGARTTVLVRAGDDRIPRATNAIRRSLEREVAAGRLSSEGASARLGRLVVTDDPGSLRACPLVIESVAEDLAAKRAVVDVVEAAAGPDVVIASTTSTIPAAFIGARARRPDRVLVAHYIWPAHRMPLVEVAIPDGSAPDAVGTLLAALQAQRKTWFVAADRAGFLVTRVLFALWDEAVSLVLEGASPTQVDEAMEAAGWRMGPLRVMDAAGLQSTARIAAFVAPYVDERFPHLSLLTRMTAAGWTGTADGGFYAYRADGRDPNAAALLALRSGGIVLGLDADVTTRCMTRVAAEIDRCVDDAIVPTFEDAVDAVGVALGFGHASGALRAWLETHVTVERQALAGGTA